jgi:hypothetical protein
MSDLLKFNYNSYKDSPTPNEYILFIPAKFMNYWIEQR